MSLHKKAEVSKDSPSAETLAAITFIHSCAFGLGSFSGRKKEAKRTAMDESDGCQSFRGRRVLRDLSLLVERHLRIDSGSFGQKECAAAPAVGEGEGRLQATGCPCRCLREAVRPPPGAHDRDGPGRPAPRNSQRRDGLRLRLRRGRKGGTQRGEPVAGAAVAAGPVSESCAVKFMPFAVNPG